MMRLPLDRPGAEPLLAGLRACRRHVVDAAAFSALLNLLYLAPTLYMLQVYDRVLPTRGMTTLLMLTGIFMLAVAALAGLDFVRTRLLVRAAARLDRKLAGPIIDATLRAGRAGPQGTSAVLREFDTLRQTMTGPGILALFDAPWSPIYIIVCFLLHPALGLLALAASAILLALSLANERSSRGPVTAAQRASATAYGGVEAMLGSAGVVQALGMREAMVRRALRERMDGADLTAEVGLRSASYLSATKAFRLLFQSLGLGLGAMLAISGRITPGAIFASSLLISRALQPIEMVTGAWRNLIQARAAFATLTKLFRDAGPPENAIKLPDPLGRIEVVGLSVASPGNDRLLLNDVTFGLEAGELLGVIGPSGAGKSTLARTLVGAMPMHEGTVRIDGASLIDWPEQQLSRAVGYVPQENALFRGTIKDNIARFDTELRPDGAVDEGVVAAALFAGAHDFILRLPRAYTTMLGWGGAGLSTGQMQRIALARALYGQPKLLILDEPNAALDAEGEASLMTALARAREEKVTVILVAHRASVLQNADKLLVLRDGKVEMFGTRTAVLTRLAGAAATQAPVSRAEAVS